MSDDITALEPLVLTVGQPLRISVYNSIAAAIHSGHYPLGALLPSDADLCLTLGVSRTVIREALLFLEEDRLIRTRRGIGRYVADSLPTLGLERLCPVEQILDAPGSPVSTVRVLHETQVASAYLARELDLTVDDETQVWESIVTRDGVPICVAFEAMLGAAALGVIDPVLAECAAAEHPGGRTLLGVIRERLGFAGLTSHCELSAGLPGDARSRQLALEPSQAVLIITQSVRRKGVAIYSAKYVVSPEAGSVSLAQSASL
ncbi:hypothetical protein BH09ACT6_BH09ACT6_21580 [soil metagenome]